MLEQQIGIKYPVGEERQNYLRNSSDGMETVSYAKPFTPAEMAKQRELLTDASIMLADINEAKKQAMDRFKEEAKEYEEQRKQAIKNLKMKAEVVEEECFKIFDEDDNMVGFYNSEGLLVSSRQAFPNERQKSLFHDFRKTGTEDN